MEAFLSSVMSFYAFSRMSSIQTIDVSAVIAKFKFRMLLLVDIQCFFPLNGVILVTLSALVH